MAKQEQKLMLGPFEVKSGKETPSRMAVVIWGPATCGKTTFAATAPGKKLWISLGDNEHITVAHREDVVIVDVSNLGYQDLFKQAQNDNPFGLDKFLSENQDVCTVVLDSVTALEYKALQKAVGEGIGRSARNSFVPTMELPGISAYGGRNAIVLQTLTGVLRVTAKHNVHVIFTAHEADPVMIEGQGTVDYYAIQLGGKLINNVTWRLSEIWYMFQETTGDRKRGIAVRPTRKRKPMKSRMFRMNEDADFVLDYDAELPDDAPGQMTIAQWYDAWMDNDKGKISIPKPATKGNKK